MPRVSGWSSVRRIDNAPAVSPCDSTSAGIGSSLLRHLRSRTERALLVGTWKAADWAVRFYERRGFRLVPDEEKVRLLRRYWSVPERQIERSVVLVVQ